jgi:predicted metal-dependent hydrolase
LSLARGIDLFNSRKYWEAHEAWERLWLVSDGDAKLFLQGLIQLAAAYHHVQRGTFRGAVRLLDAALEKLARVPEGYMGVNRTDACATARIHREKIARGELIAPEELPELRYN